MTDFSFVIIIAARKGNSALTLSSRLKATGHTAFLGNLSFPEKSHCLSEKRFECVSTVLSTARIRGQKLDSVPQKCPRHPDQQNRRRPLLLSKSSRSQKILSYHSCRTVSHLRPSRACSIKIVCDRTLEILRKSMREDNFKIFFVSTLTDRPIFLR